MRKHILAWFVVLLLPMIVFGRLSVPIENHGNVKITDITPNVAVQGQGTKIIVKGEGFDENSSVFVSLDIGNEKNIYYTKDEYLNGVEVTSDKKTIFGFAGNTIKLFDVSTLKSIDFISSFEVNQTIKNIDISDDNTLLAILGENKSFLYDISNFKNIQLLSSFDSKENTYDGIIKISHNSADIFIASNSYSEIQEGEDIYCMCYGTLQIFDISNKKNITHLSNFDDFEMKYVSNTSSINKIKETNDGKYLFIGSDGDGISLLDISNKLNPIKVVNYGAPTYGQFDINQDANILFINKYQNIQILDISDKLNYLNIANINTKDYISRFTLSSDENKLNISTASGIEIYNISNLQSIKYITSISLNSSSITELNNNIIFSYNDSKLNLLDTSNLSSLQSVNKIEISGQLYGKADIYKNGQYYIATNSIIYDLEDKNLTYTLPSIIYGNSLHSIDKSLDIYMSANGYMCNLSNIDNIICTEPFSNLDFIDAKYIKSKNYIISISQNSDDNSNSEYHFINTSDMSNPKYDFNISIFDTNQTSKEPKSIVITDDEKFVYTVGEIININAHAVYSSFLQVLDISDINNTKIIYTGISNEKEEYGLINVKNLINLCYPKKVILSKDNNYLYISTDCGLYIYNITDKMIPKFYKHLNTNGMARDIELTDDGKFLFIATYSSGIKIVDLQNTSNPKIIGSISSQYYAPDITIDEIRNQLIIASDTEMKFIPINFIASTFTDQNTLEFTFPSYDPLYYYNLFITNDNENKSSVFGGISLISPEEKNSMIPKNLSLRTLDSKDGIINIDLNQTQAIKLNGLLEYESGLITNVFKELNTTEYTISSSDKNKAYYFNDKLIFNKRGRVTITISAKGLSDSLTFNITDSSDPTTFQDSHKDAIIILGHLDDKGGELSTDNQYDPLRYSINKIGNNIYKTLSKFGLSKENIYYFNPNGEEKLVDEDNDKIKDNAVDFVDFNWSDVLTTINNLDANSTDPLILWMVDHGLNQEIKISANKSVTASQIKKALDDFQNKTGRPVIAIFDACYSGSISDVVKDNNRMVISSADSSSVTYMNPYGVSFSYYLLKYLRQGNSVKDSFDKANIYFNKRLASNGLSINPTYSNINTNLAKKLAKTLYNTISLDNNYTISDFDIGNGEPSFLDYTGKDTNITLTSNSLELKTKTDIPYLSLAKVYASITPPNPVVDVNGSKLIKSELVPLSLDTSDNYFKSDYSFTNEGNYSISYLIEDDDNNIYSSNSVLINKTNKIEDNSTSKIQNLTLANGWNLVSLPVDMNLSQNEIKTVFPNAKIIWTYSSGKWSAYSSNTLIENKIDNSNIDTISTINKSDGFWVNNDGMEQISFNGMGYNILTDSKLTDNTIGWKLLGSGSNIDVSELNKANNNISVVWSYASGVWSAYSSNKTTQNLINNSSISPISNINQGVGFWVNIK